MPPTQRHKYGIGGPIVNAALAILCWHRYLMQSTCVALAILCAFAILCRARVKPVLAFRILVISELGVWQKHRCILIAELLEPKRILLAPR